MAGKTKTTQTQQANLSKVQIVDQTVMRGPGGETHQVADGETPVLTTAQGIPVYDDENLLKIGTRGRR